MNDATVLRELSRPFSYLSIAHVSRTPIWINWIIPTGLGAVIVIFPWAFNIQINVYGETGVISRILGFVQSLAGFYIAALAAIATFTNPDMDRLMPGDTPSMMINYNGRLTRIPVTRRRFLSSMFAFLTASSLVLTLISIAVLALAPAIASLITPFQLTVAKLGGTFLYMASLMQLACVTLWGLYYLGERIHTPDAGK